MQTNAVERIGWAGAKLRDMRRQVKKMERTHTIIESSVNRCGCACCARAPVYNAVEACTVYRGEIFET